ncbi:MAG TPA: acyltransferase [Acidimicrobiales bacterium]|jgi:peptidoglycan/LPS O-acetylase OafA/YrhL|nr:acyltransferase [Acidimicrobiales bacterium]
MADDGEQGPGGDAVAHDSTAAPPSSGTATAGDPSGWPVTSESKAAESEVAPPATSNGPAPSKFRLGNRPPLTGIRALGIAAVLIYHSNFHTLPGSWAMLQVFFVLSGFLITAMLAGEGQRNGRISLKGFYSRRVVRLGPPLLLTVGLLAIYASLVHVADASQRVWGDSAAALFYYADYRQAFGHAPFFGYLAQTWSLSVEEQFYIIWSVLMVTAVALHRRRLAYVFAVVGIAISVSDRLWLVYRAPHFNNALFTRVYYAFDSRADAILLGCLLGLLANDGYLSRWKPWAIRMAAFAAMASTAFMAWVLFYAPLFTEALAVWWLPLTTLACASVLVYFVVSPEGIGSRIVGISFLVFVGDLSYTLYLVHFPVDLALEPNGTSWPSWVTQVVRLAIIFAIAIASWYLMERPLMRWRQRSAAR